MISPVDAIVGAHGPIEGTSVFQAKGFPYTLKDLIGPLEDVHDWCNGTFMTLRLTSSMYHRFHAPYDCKVEQVRYFSGDTWNVNPIALKRVEKLFCKNERVLIRTTFQGDGPCSGQRVALVPVAAILVASIRLHFLMYFCICAIPVRTKLCAMPTLQKDRKWAGFSMAPRSLFWRQRAFRFSRGCARGPTSKWVKRLCAGTGDDRCGAAQRIRVQACTSALDDPPEVSLKTVKNGFPAKMGHTWCSRLTQKCDGCGTAANLTAVSMNSCSLSPETSMPLSPETISSCAAAQAKETTARPLANASGTTLP
jgi:hypothetical protein